MRRYGWVLTVLVIVAFFIIRHRSVPIAPTPDNAIKTAEGIRIPLVSREPIGTGEVWILARKANHVYVVNVYNRQALLHVFTAGSELGKDATGITYRTADDIRLGYFMYQATDIHVNSDGRSGYIDLKPVPTTGAGGNQVPSGTGNQASTTANNAATSGANNS